MSHLAAPLPGVPLVQAGDGDAALVLLVVTRVAQAGIQVSVTILLGNIALETLSGELFCRMFIIILPWSISTLGDTGAGCGSRCSIPSSCQSCTPESPCPLACEPDMRRC